MLNLRFTIYGLNALANHRPCCFTKVAFNSQSHPAVQTCNDHIQVIVTEDKKLYLDVFLSVVLAFYANVDKYSLFTLTKNQDILHVIQCLIVF